MNKNSTKSKKLKLFSRKRPNSIEQRLEISTEQLRQGASYPRGDRVAFYIGVILTLLVVIFFTWKMVSNLTKDWALMPVPTTTPTPPLERSNKS